MMIFRHCFLVFWILEFMIVVVQMQSLERNISCASHQCENGGSCVSNPQGESYCNCTHMYTGEFCQHINSCRTGSKPRCHNGGTCKFKITDTNSPMIFCDCPLGFTAALCEIPVPNSCDSNPCMNAGVCNLVSLTNYTCSCATGFRGRNCENSIHNCIHNPCWNGGTCIEKFGNYECVCPSGFVGPRCEGDINECLSNPCMALGTQNCTQLVNDYRCDCKPGYMGRHCELYNLDLCSTNPCLKGCSCTNAPTGYMCVCPEDFHHLYAPCKVNPCKNRGVCILKEDSTYICVCPVGTTGDNCELHENEDLSSSCMNGGTCHDEIVVNPWENCTASTNCTDVFLNEECNIECNNANCLFDGFECEQKLPSCSPHYDNYCLRHYANDYCDYGCNNAECDWDGLDCESEPSLAQGSLVIVVLMEPEDFRDKSASYLREIGHTLRNTVRIKKDMNGYPMIYPWQTKDVAESNENKDPKTGTKVVMEIDNRKCKNPAGTECFHTAFEGANFLRATTSRQALSFPLEKISSE